MGYFARKKIVTDGLVFELDAGNKISKNVNECRDILNPSFLTSPTNGAVLNDGELFTDGVNDWHHITNSSHMTQFNEFSIEVVFYSYSTGTNRALAYANFQWNATPMLLYYTDTSIWFMTNPLNGITSTDRTQQQANVGTTLNKWNHCTFVKDNNNQYIYYEGQLINTKPLVVAGATNTITDLYFGMNWGYGYAHAGLKSWKHWDRVLTADEIAQNYEAQKGRLI